MKKGFALIELLAVIIVMAILAMVVIPVIENGLKTNSGNALEIQKTRIIDAAKDWSLKNLSLLPNEYNTEYKVKLSELKKGYITINVKNPDTGNILSDQSYVNIINNNGDYEYEANIYDIPDIVESNSQITFTGNFAEENINLGGTIGNYSINVVANGNTLTYSTQYIFNNNEVDKIDTDQPGTYSIVYTVLYNEKIYKRVKTITIK